MKLILTFFGTVEIIQQIKQENKAATAQTGFNSV
jgi:hypothetical protein